MFLHSDLLAKHGVQAVFSDRQGGCSLPPFDSLNLGQGLGDDVLAIAQNLALLCKETKFPLPHQVQQVHGDSVFDCEGFGLSHDTQADILITSSAQTALAVRTADCLPLLLADVKAGVVAAVHAGWKGTVLQVAQKAVAHMCQRGASVDNIMASLGPCIGVCCFEVSEDVAAQLQSSCGQCVSTKVGGSVYANLSQANAQQLKNIGLLPQNIETLSLCTACSTDPCYFSYRRDDGQTGRQLAMIKLS